MLRRLFSAALAALALAVSLGCGSDPQGAGRTTARQAPLGDALYPARPVPPDAGEWPAARRAAEEIVVDGCRILVIDKQDVPSLRDSAVKEFLVKEGSLVTPDQVLVQLDDRLARADVAIKEAKCVQSKADFDAAVKTRDEAEKMWRTTVRLHPNDPQNEEVAKYKLSYERYVFEAIAKKAAIQLADQELAQSNVVLGMHQLKAAKPGVVKALHKKPGESVKNLDPVLQVYNVDRLRAEVLLERQYAAPLRENMEVVIEPNRPAGPEQTLTDHLLDVTAVAVSNDAPAPLIVSASDDGTARVWGRDPQAQRWQVRRVLRHPRAVKAVACTPRGAAGHLCLTGAADGRGRLWDLGGTSEQPARELAEAHHGSITSVAFAPDGKTCATGGEDRQIRLWDAATGQLRYTLPATHRGAITTCTSRPTATWSAPATAPSVSGSCTPAAPSWRRPSRSAAATCRAWASARTASASSSTRARRCACWRCRAAPLRACCAIRRAAPTSRPSPSSRPTAGWC